VVKTDPGLAGGILTYWLVHKAPQASANSQNNETILAT